jgi:hypothetical protein
MIDHFRASEALQRLRISRRCYTLLHHARVDPDNLEHFYRTYRLPRNGFFPLFFRVKRDYLAERERKREERRRYILETMRRLPAPVLDFVRYVGRLEQRYNAAGAYPLWEEHLLPSTKKQVHAYLRYGEHEWLRLFRAHLARLAERYRDFDEATAEKLLACYLLECLPDGWSTGQAGGQASRGSPSHGAEGSSGPGAAAVSRPPAWPAAREVRRAYRSLSLRHHPDRGGDGALFVELKRARDLLLEDG